MENPHEFFFITPWKSTSFLIDYGISACFFQYPLKFHSLNSPYLFSFWNRVVIKMCLVSIILKEIRSGWIRKYQVLLFFMLRQLKATDSLRNSDEVAWNLAISEANLCRGSQKSFVKFTEKNLGQSLFFNYSATLKEDSGTSAFLWILKFFKNTFFCQIPSGYCFCSLKNHSEILEKSLQNLTLECCCNNLKTPAKKFVLVNTCIGNWLF